MESVPVAFVDALCATLLKKELGCLQKIGRRWSRTVTTHYSRRRELSVYLDVNPEGTQVWIEVKQVDVRIPQNVDFASLSGNDRIRGIWVTDPAFGAQSEKMPMERFRTKVLPLLNSLADAYNLEISSSHRYLHCLTDSLFSGLRALPLKIETGYFGGKCVEFVEQQIALGRLRKLTLRGQEWPDSMKASLKSFLKSPNFVYLDLFWTNLTVDLDMLIIMVKRFLKGDLRKETLVLGKPSEEMRDLHCKSLRGKTLPLLDGLTTRPETFRREYSKIFWSGPDQRKLFVKFSGSDFVAITPRSLYIQLLPPFNNNTEEKRFYKPAHRGLLLEKGVTAFFAMQNTPQPTYMRHGEAQAMESVPVAFVDTLCAALKKEDLEELQQIGRPWSRTVTTHFSRRREFKVYLDVNPEETEVLFEVKQIGFHSSVNLESFAWSKYDRIRYIQMDQSAQFGDRLRIRGIWVRDPIFGALPEKIPMERFRTKLLPVLTSLADDYVLDMSSCYFNLIKQLRKEFIERQIKIGHLEQLELY
uniref:F-box domain-containing protein n=1 Tax=Steinernema glaseri TaxID=37863 RepID=A0A1I8AGT4_9BILA